MKKKRVLELIQKKGPVRKADLFEALKVEDPNFRKNAFEVHLSRLRKENKITSLYGKIITTKKMLEYEVLS